jgi:DnaK suppressor protein
MTKKPVKKPVAKISKISNKKRYIPSVKEKYMCTKHKQFFTEELLKWKNDIIKSNSLTNLLNSSDDSVSSADMVDQASSYTDKSVEMKALVRSRKLIGKINAALQRIKDDTYGYCEETSEPIGLKRLRARPVATLSIEAQERHERDEKIFIDD